MVTLLQPSIRAVGLVLPMQYEGTILGAPLPLRQSLMIIWPQSTGLIAATILLFAVGYVRFQRQEIRA
jgi:ABC-2 type transport system permease protein